MLEATCLVDPLAASFDSEACNGRVLRTVGTLFEDEAGVDRTLFEDPASCAVVITLAGMIG